MITFYLFTNTTFFCKSNDSHARWQTRALHCPLALPPSPLRGRHPARRCRKTTSPCSPSVRVSGLDDLGVAKDIIFLPLSLHQSQSRSSSTRTASTSQPDPGAPNRATNLRDRGCGSGRRCGCCAKACSLEGRLRMFSARGRGVVHDPVDGVLHSAQGACAPRFFVRGRGGSLHSASLPRRVRRGGQRRTPLGCGCPSARGHAGRPARETPSPRGSAASLGRTAPASCQRPPCWFAWTLNNHLRSLRKNVFVGFLSLMLSSRLGSSQSSREEDGLISEVWVCLCLY
jgi:hypothetical protein